MFVKSWSRVLMSLLFCLPLVWSVSAHSGSSPAVVAQVHHWWRAPGELKALRELALAYERNDARFSDTGRFEFRGARETAIKRMTFGYPPTLVHWNAGSELQEFADIGMLGELRDSALLKRWKQELYSFVYKDIVKNGRVVAIPLNIHAENWMWVNKPVYDRLGLSPPRSWPELVKQAEIIRDAGVQPLAMGLEGYQIHVLFNNILLGYAGRDVYDQVYGPLPLTQVARDELREVMRIFLRLRDLQPELKPEQSWYESGQVFAAGAAALHFMGDWARAEFRAAGLKEGEDYTCALAPGTEQFYVYVLDVFLLGRADAADDRKAQLLAGQTFTDKAVQFDYTRAKGAVPVLRDMDGVLFDRCASIARTVLEDEASWVPQKTFLLDINQISRMYSFVLDLWTSPQATPAKAAADIEAMFVAD